MHRVADAISRLQTKSEDSIPLADEIVVLTVAM